MNDFLPCRKALPPYVPPMEGSRIANCASCETSVWVVPFDRTESQRVPVLCIPCAIKSRCGEKKRAEI